MKHSVGAGFPGQPAGSQERHLTLRALALLFLKFGAIGFGGGLAVVALLEHELIQRRKLMDPEDQQPDPWPHRRADHLCRP